MAKSQGTSNLLIVESPAKAKTIAKYLAEIALRRKTGDTFEVQASFGHVRDLPKDDSAIDVAGGFEPVYIVPDDKREQVDKLKKLAKKVDTVWLATDEDREGEAIAWHLCEVLELDPNVTQRIVFNEITRSAIERAIDQPRSIDMALVDAQQARRVLDRLVGFELSPILWKKVKYGLSAGRVQSVALRLIVEREREVMGFTPEAFFQVQAELLAGGRPFKAGVTRRMKQLTDAEQFLQRCAQATFTVASVEQKPGRRTPAAPFTTSTLQQEASRKLGYSVAQTMRLAQGLYEAGHITYMRTDSVTLSETALQASQAEINTAFGERYHKRRTYSNKTANAQEAHEAIRPTDFGARVVATAQEQKLYELIWKRTLASQMADAELERTVAEISVTPAGTKETLKDVLTATGEVIKFDGFLKLYLEGKDEDDDADDSGLLPPLSVGQQVSLRTLTATERYTRPPARYTEASLVKALEERGIGRPSTYAPTISTIQKREYVAREDREGVERRYRVLSLEGSRVTTTTAVEMTGAERGKLFPSDLGFLVTDFLVEYFPDVVDYSFTKTVEEEFDEISRGERKWRQMMAEFYEPFHKKVEKTEKNAARVQGERQLGIDPKTGKPVVARLGRYGPIAQIGAADDPTKTFASLRPNQRLETLTLDEALTLFKLPRTLGEFEGEELVVNVGRFGPYVRHGKAFVSIPKAHDPFDISFDTAVALVVAKRKADSERIIKTFEGTPLQVLNGRWGPYLTDGAKNAKIPKGTEPASLTEDEVRELLAAAPEARGRFAKRGKAGDKKTAEKGAPKKPTVARTPRSGKRSAAAEDASSAPAKRKTPATPKARAIASAAKAAAPKAKATKPATKVTATKATAMKTVTPKPKAAKAEVKPEKKKATEKKATVKKAKAKAEPKPKKADKKSDKKKKKK